MDQGRIAKRRRRRWMSQNNRLLFPNQDTVPSFGTIAADSSDSALLAGQDALVCVYDGAAYIYFGKASGIWKTLWVDTTGGLLRGDEAGTYAVTLASDGPAPFDAAYAFATDRKAGIVPVSTGFLHNADCLVYFDFTISSSGNTAFLVRVSSLSPQNYWEIQLRSSGDMRLYEWVAAAFTGRGTASAVLSGGESIAVICDGTTIVGRYDGALAWSYASASNFSDKTAGNISFIGTDGAISNIVSWPRTLSGTAASILNKVSA